MNFDFCYQNLGQRDILSTNISSTVISTTDERVFFRVQYDEVNKFKFCTKIPM